MVNPQLLNYLQAQLAKGQDKESLKKTLLKAGWPAEEISQALLSLTQSDLVPSTFSPIPSSHDYPAANESIRSIPRVLCNQPVSSPTGLSASPVQIPQKVVEPTPPVSQTAPPSYPIKIEKPWGLKNWALAFLGFLIFVGMIAGGVFYYLTLQKKETRDLVGKGLEQFSRLETIYTEIISTLKEKPGEKKEHSADLLGVSDLKVLGLEDNPTIKSTRKLGQLYMQADKASEEIGDLTLKLKEKANSFPLAFVLKEDKEFFQKTQTFSEENSELLAYLDKDNQLGIKVFTTAFEIGSSLANVIQIGGTEVSFQDLDEKINQLDKLQRQYAALSSFSLPEELRDQRRGNLEYFAKFKTQLQNISEALKRNDLRAVTQNLLLMLNQSLAESETTNVQAVSFWQDKQLRSLQGLKSDWEKFNQKL